MAQFINMYKVELNDGAAPVVQLKQMHYADIKANRIGAIVTLNKEPFTLSGTCSGTAILADGSTVPMTGVVSGNTAYIELASSCYSVEGHIEVYVKLTTGGVTTTLVAGVGTVRLTETDAVIDPGTIIPSVSALITAIEDAVASIPADYSGLLATIAPTFSSSASYAVGDFVWYSGNLYRFTAEHTGSWTGTDAVRTTVSEGLNSGAVRYDTDMNITAAQKATARHNILAAGQNDLAPLFSASGNYTAGQYVYYNDVLYRFTADHPAGAWTGTDAAVAVLGGDVSDLKSAIDNLNYIDITGVTGKYLNASTGAPESNTNWDYAEINLRGLDGETFTLETTLYNNFPAGWVLYDTEGERIDGDTTASDTIILPSGVGSIGISMFKFRSDRTWRDIKFSCAFGKSVAKTYELESKTSKTYVDQSIASVSAEKVDKNGTGQVTAKNIEGMTEAETRSSANLFPTATLASENHYVGGINGDTGKVSLYTNNAYDTYIIPVDGISEYTFTFVNFGCVVADLEYTPVGNILTNVREINSTGGSYILFSFPRTSYPPENYIITKPITYYDIPDNWIIPTEGGNKQPTDTVSDQIAASGTLEIAGRTALKDGEVIAFKGFFSEFNGFTLNFIGASITNYIAVTSDTIAIKNTTTTPTPANHGLTISNYVSLVCQFVSGQMKVTLYSNGGSYTATVNWYQTGGTVSQPQIKSDGTVFTDATLSVSYDAVGRDIWYFGDSYTGVDDNARWPYYYKDDGYIHYILINGSAGGTTGGAMVAFKALLKYGTPKIAVLATGMNDGSDGESAPPTLYVNLRTEFIGLCESNGIEPVFATIPTVPTVNNEQKNAWIRGSNYRYIDYAKAVGADGTGAWYNGMLSGDNVHPSATGAKALYSQLLIDLPEVTVE